MALVNGAELVIDDVTGFVRDIQYRRHYALDRFHLAARKATPAERMKPFDRYRRGLAKCIARGRPFHQRRYVEQEERDFDARLLDFKVSGTVYLDGYWQSEGYFKDVEKAIRSDFRITPPEDAVNRQMASRIAACNAVAVHVRWFDQPGSKSRSHNASRSYYRRAITEIAGNVSDPHYFLFSDDPPSAKCALALPDDKVTCVDHNCGDENAYADLWLMAQCRYFIIANSTFSWWAAWLAHCPTKIVIAPATKTTGITSWNFAGQLPDQWIKI